MNLLALPALSHQWQYGKYKSGILAFHGTWKYFGESSVSGLTALNCYPASSQTSPSYSFHLTSINTLNASKRPFWLGIFSFPCQVGISCSSWWPCLNQETVLLKSLCGMPRGRIHCVFQRKQSEKNLGVKWHPYLSVLKNSLSIDGDSGISSRENV